jgi:hypothetical protein
MQEWADEMQITKEIQLTHVEPKLVIKSGKLRFIRDWACNLTKERKWGVLEEAPMYNRKAGRESGWHLTLECTVDVAWKYRNLLLVASEFVT